MTNQGGGEQAESSSGLDELKLMVAELTEKVSVQAWELRKTVINSFTEPEKTSRQAAVEPCNGLRLKIKEHMQKAKEIVTSEDQLKEHSSKFPHRQLVEWTNCGEN